MLMSGQYHEANPGQYHEKNPGQYEETEEGKYLEINPGQVGEQSTNQAKLRGNKCEHKWALPSSLANPA